MGWTWCQSVTSLLFIFSLFFLFYFYFYNLFQGIMALPDLVVQALALTIRYLKEFGLERIICFGSSFRPFSNLVEMTLSANTLHQLEVFLTPSWFEKPFWESFLLFYCIFYLVGTFQKSLLFSYLEPPMICHVLLSTFSLCTSNANNFYMLCLFVWSVYGISFLGLKE